MSGETRGCQIIILASVMAPSKVIVSAYEMQLKKRQKDRKLKPTGKVDKTHEGKRKDKTKTRKMKTTLVEDGVRGGAVDAGSKATSKKLRLNKRKKYINYGRSDLELKGESSKAVHLEDEYHTDEKGTNKVNSQEPEPTRGLIGSNSIQEGKDAFTWLIAPIKPDEFFQNAWEKAPLHVKRTNFPDYYKDVLSTQKIHEILRDNYVLFSKNVDVTKYDAGERKTGNPAGRAVPAVVWNFFKKGWSVRMLNPQTYSPELRRLNATLQDFFGCFVGTNSYLTPANSQGFAPHYDDIEAFILQIEGRKQWKVYAPRTPEETLPRFSSPNFTQDELQKPILEVTLNPGDLLYFPRGFIHQASTEPDCHSLHVTLSCYQKNSWGDFLEKLIPATLAIAQEDDLEFRKGLPLGYWRHLGISNNEQFSTERNAFFKTLQKLFERMLKLAPVDAAVDQMVKQFMHDALPPVLTEQEETCSVFSENLTKVKDNVEVSESIKLKSDSRIKLIRSHILRLVKEDDSNDDVQVYHCVDNSLEFHGEEQQMFTVSPQFAMGIEKLIHSYPFFIPVFQLPLNETQEKLDLATLLWEKGLLLTDKPLED